MTDHREIFPPFVLTQTTDIRFNQLIQDAKCNGLSSTQFYQQLVGYEYETALSTLVLMGRPGWDRTKLGDLTNKEDPTEVIQLAADMLLGGWSAPRRESYRQESLFGVASMICRLGLSPSSWSPLASHTVAACMATLVYMTVSHDHLVTSYASDPVLTFGAARVWYQTDNWDHVQWTLATHILPQFRKVLQQDMVDTSGRRHDFISRVLLLLAMDATGLVVESAPWSYEPLRRYAGAFHSVEAFLSVLYGDHPLAVRDGYQNDVTSAFGSRVQDMLDGWREWKVGFSHFVHMANEPSEDELWAMLARRAAGVFPRNYAHVDLFVPIFNGTSVSMILVKTTRRAGGDLPLVASLMRPSSVFTNACKHLGPTNVVRVLMRLEGDAGNARSQFFLVDTGFGVGDVVATAESYVLCLEGLHACKARCLETARDSRDQIVTVVSTNVAEELRLLLEPWWDTRSMVKVSLRTGESIPDASRVSPEWLLGRHWAETNEDQATGSAATATVAAQATTPVSKSAKRRKRKRNQRQNAKRS